MNNLQKEIQHLKAEVDLARNVLAEKTKRLHNLLVQEAEFRLGIPKGCLVEYQCHRQKKTGVYEGYFIHYGTPMIKIYPLKVDGTRAMNPHTRQVVEKSVEIAADA